MKIVQIVDNLKFTDYLSILKSFSGLCANVGVIIPAFLSLTSYPPPLLFKASSITSAFSAAFLILAFFRKQKKIKRKAACLISLSIVFLCLYIFVYFMSVVQISNQESNTTENQNIAIQIGIKNWRWSLTESGKKLPNDSPEGWLLGIGNVSQNGAEEIWKPWIIYSLGIVLIILYFLLFISWTYGWALLAKQKMIRDRVERQCPSS